MPRANRFYIPNAVWHITHRCHDRQFLLGFECDRLRWKYWLFQARKRYGLVVLNYIATSNHVHLLVQDAAPGSIARAMQLIAGRTAQEYNQRKQRRGSFWEDRYFASVVATDQHLLRCMVYIDLNMVRAGVVSHPGQWHVCGFNEIQNPPQRYRIIDWPKLCFLTGFADKLSLQLAHGRWVEDSLVTSKLEREPRWTESIAVGPRSYVEQVKKELGIKALYRTVEAEDEYSYVIRDGASA